MRVLYFDCFSGISGDMTVGALLDLGIDKDKFIEELKKINVDGFHIKFDRVNKNGIDAFDFDVIIDNHQHIHEKETNHTHLHHKENHHHDHNHKEEHKHSHHHEHRNLFNVNTIIENSDITQKAKELAKKIFMRVALAEAKVHGKPLEEVHFHEVGAIDSIVDIIGTAICIDMLNVDKIYSSVVNDGFGFIMCQHGMIPVPVPATAEIFANSNALTKQIDVETELVTPTGAAIIAELSESFSVMPEINITKIGFGAGKKSLKIPNILRVVLGEISENKNDTIAVLETNIDDCSGEILGYTMERLLENGARDVFFTPIIMKKNRPAYKLTVICHENICDILEKIIFMETTTIGIRKRLEKRTCLNRTLDSIETKYGKLDVKTVDNLGYKAIYPEYESAKKLASENSVALKDIYKEIK